MAWAAATGRKAEAKALLTELLALSERRYVSPIGIAFIYLNLGDTDRGFEWMERAYAEHSNGVAYMAVEPYLAPWRSDPRYRNLVRRVGLPE